MAEELWFADEFVVVLLVLLVVFVEFCPEGNVAFEVALPPAVLFVVELVFSAPM